MDANQVSDLDICAYCGKEFEPNVRYPVVTVQVDEGPPLLYGFCDYQCKGAWIRMRNEN